MEKLKVGDKVYNARRGNWSRFNYTFATVERLTATLAILDNGTKLVNEAKKYFYNKDLVYLVHGDRSKNWSIVTDAVLEEAKAENERIKISNWFDAKKFTDEEKKAIYYLLNPQN